jgi:hypothetical protein
VKSGALDFIESHFTERVLNRGERSPSIHVAVGGAGGFAIGEKNFLCRGKRLLLRLGDKGKQQFYLFVNSAIGREELTFRASLESQRVLVVTGQFREVFSDDG